MPSGKKAGSYLMTSEGVRGALSWNSELFYYEKTLEVKFC